MSIRPVAAVCLSLSLSMASAWAQTEVSSVPVEQVEPEKILVVGQRPGPGLWKVSKDDHVLWVFGTYRPLPKNMEWRSQQVETVIAQSQELLKEPGASLEFGYLRSALLLPFMLGVDKSPNGAMLRDQVPAGVHERWLALRKKYLKDDESYERKRPVFAAEELFDKAMAHNGLSHGQEIRKEIVRLAEKNKLKITSTTVDMDVDSPLKAIREFKKAPMDDAACFNTAIARLETDMEAIRVRANAWAKGDIDVIRKLDYPEHESACTAAFVSNAVLREQAGLGTVPERMRTKWLAAAEKALATNRSTVAMVPLSKLLDPKGYLADLQAKGYTVERPD
ncbi:TraB/GumN family protein [Pseudoduganella plicata]|uniref:GumN protein n=1 Tax=Pseudoduganella plicata TaxID=321984 RepID=A0A4P7BEK0_9BURK|nr:TraB/GumN family protein [Pseudoduganella plicata]QBQ37156.1 TraB/GumN family protein [Pseudoduganella plicata]GGY98879.1 GumN protein [Pseudoduganella plicata]